MKVIYISNFYTEFKSAFISQLELLAENIISDGGEVVFIFPIKSKKLNWCKKLNYKYRVEFVSCIDRRNKKLVINELKEIFSIYKPNIIHSHFDGYDVPITKAASKDVIKIYHRHNEFDVSKLSLLKKIYASILIKKNLFYLKKNGYSIFISNEMERRFIENKLVYKDKSKTILNGINIERLDNLKNITNDIPTVFSFTGNWYAKGADILLKALEYINYEKIKVKLITIGDEEKFYRSYGSIPKWVELMKPTDNIVEYYSMADIFVTTSRKETFSYALAEAIYCELPCISSDIDGVNWAHDFSTVSFFKNEDINSLIEQIIKFTNYEVSYEEIKKSKQLIIDKFSDKVWIKNILNLYKEVME